MIEVTKGVLEKLWYGEWDKELVNQILDDYEKARKWDTYQKELGCYEH